MYHHEVQQQNLVIKGNFIKSLIIEDIFQIVHGN